MGEAGFNLDSPYKVEEAILLRYKTLGNRSFLNKTSRRHAACK